MQRGTLVFCCNSPLSVPPVLDGDLLMNAGFPKVADGAFLTQH